MCATCRVFRCAASLAAPQVATSQTYNDIPVAAFLALQRMFEGTMAFR